MGSKLEGNRILLEAVNQKTSLSSWAASSGSSPSPRWINQQFGRSQPHWGITHIIFAARLNTLLTLWVSTFLSIQSTSAWLSCHAAQISGKDNVKTPLKRLIIASFTSYWCVCVRACVFVCLCFLFFLTLAAAQSTTRTEWEQIQFPPM